MGSPLYPLGILLSYVYFVKVAGPRYMKDRPAYSLNRIVALYNIIQILLNVAIFIKVSALLELSIASRSQDVNFISSQFTQRRCQ